MKYKEFKEKVEDWGRKYHYEPVIDVASTYIEIAIEDEYYMDRICTIHKSKRFVLDLNSNLFKSFFDDARNDLFKIVSEFSATKPEDREDERDSLDKIIHKLKEIQTNSEYAIRSVDNMSWGDVMYWISKEIEKNRDLKNILKDVIIDLEEYRKTHSIEGLINDEQKNRQIALELECKAEYYRGKADNYLKILKEIDSCEMQD